MSDRSHAFDLSKLPFLLHNAIVDDNGFGSNSTGLYIYRTV
jgi:hypothetical protein